MKILPKTSEAKLPPESVEYIPARIEIIKRAVERASSAAYSELIGRVSFQDSVAKKSAQEVVPEAYLSAEPILDPLTRGTESADSVESGLLNLNDIRKSIIDSYENPLEEAA